uniref:NAA35-like N-terminal domain-containing protein n=1 Tax=Kwoniella dejecticola CBS 10117 TaxID=1296121 RepID=A0A1A5ZXC7_9TREE|nr:uncharacterized protein I303_07220 [Kwoniella dejecticola CBS 10117]OBR82460.1 hypothetical protein I303_07220 [Kwoniella dejecticola CBS 10117]
MAKPAELLMLDAMNAIQMMDDKMDSSANFSATLMPSPLYNPQSRVSPQDVCWMMDTMMALEIEWYRGATLCQSVYTALLYHNPQHLAGPSRYPHDNELSGLIQLVLRSFTLLYCKAIDLAYAELAKGHVRDGEDCWLDHYGVPVRMNDAIEDVVGLADDALEWLETGEHNIAHPWGEQLIQRMICRRNWTQYLACDFTSPQWRHSLLRVMRVAAEDIKMAENPSKEATAAFDPCIPSYLRQNMPLPSKGDPDSDNAWQQTRLMLDQLINAEVVIGKRSWDAWESQFDSACNQLENGVYLNDVAVRSMISAENASVESAILAFDDASERQDLAASKQVAAWKRLVSSYLSATTSAFLSNRSRQRRTFTILGSKWLERAAMGEYLSQYTNLSASAKVLHSIRLDCLLEAELAALDLDLVTPGDEPELWWWIQQVTRSRNHYCRGSTSKASIWANVWQEISSALILLHELVSPYTGDDRRSRAKFNLRHKHALKPIYLPNGKKVTTGVIPQYQVFTSSRKALSNLPEDRLRQDALHHLKSSTQWLDRLPRIPDTDHSVFQAYIKNAPWQRWQPTVGRVSKA